MGFEQPLFVCLFKVYHIYPMVLPPHVSYCINFMSCLEVVMHVSFYVAQILENVFSLHENFILIHDPLMMHGHDLALLGRDSPMFSHHPSCHGPLLVLSYIALLNRPHSCPEVSYHRV